MTPKQGEKTVQDLILERLDKVEEKVSGIDKLRWIIYGIGIVVAAQSGGLTIKDLLARIFGH